MDQDTYAFATSFIRAKQISDADHDAALAIYKDLAETLHAALAREKARNAELAKSHDKYLASSILHEGLHEAEQRKVAALTARVAELEAGNAALGDRARMLTLRLKVSKAEEVAATRMYDLLVDAYGKDEAPVQRLADAEMTGMTAQEFVQRRYEQFYSEHLRKAGITPAHIDEMRKHGIVVMDMVEAEPTPPNDGAAPPSP